MQLALLPLVETEFVDHAHLIADGKSGVSGAGRKAEVGILYSEASDNFKAYAVHGHRHHPEIVESLQSLEGASGRELGLTFVPHLVPMVRGILATVYARITRETDFQALFEKRFRGEPFVDVLPPGTAAGDALGARLEPLPHRGAPPDGRRHARRARRRGQPREGRRGPGRAEHEPDVRLPRDAWASTRSRVLP